MLSINSIIGSVKEPLTLPIILFIEFIRFIKLKVHKVCRPLWDILLTVARAAESKIINLKLLDSPPDTVHGESGNRE